MQVFYSAHINAKQVLINEQEHVHLTKVLRKKEGDSVFVCNGKGLLVEANIVAIEKKQTLLSVKKTVQEQKTNSNRLILAVSPTKKREKYEWMLEKCIEIGLHEIIPFYAKHSERKALNVKRLESISLSAMKQSKALFLPKIQEECTFKELLKQVKASQKYIAYVDEHALQIKEAFKTLNKQEDVLVLVGPEGGFTAEEVQAAKDNGFIPLSLGEKRLRTETAGVFISSAYQLV